MSHKIDNFTMDTLQDRRKDRDRRSMESRRTEMERRHDFRDDPNAPHRSISIRIWLRSVINARLGVDRRKETRRRSDRRRPNQNAVLTPEEINELLSF
ncbi:MAG: hypothetical protein QNK28_03855 [Desulfobacterales bacterium]|nr:hypothetical protein [Desulfobacterales bacterium]